ncbi:MAG: DUF6249 domain-containing protein [Chthoniobacterales bacterium]
MKTSLLTYLCSIALALTAFGQSPSPSASATATASPSVSASATISATPGDEDSDIARSVRSKVRRHMGVQMSGPRKDFDLNGLDGETAGGIAVAIIAVIFSMVFGAPVLIVAAVMFFSYLKSRSLHRTVREMVAKGQPVPPEMFAAPGTKMKARSDLRRGIVLSCIGGGLIFFLAGVNGGFAGGEWAIGMIPLMIGAGYLLVWKLEGPRNNANNTLRDNPPVS